MPPKGRSDAGSVKGRYRYEIDVLTSKVWILLNRFRIALLAERTENLQVVVGGRAALAIVQIPELRDDEFAVATVLVQIGSAWGRVCLVVLGLGQSR